MRPFEHENNKDLIKLKTYLIFNIFKNLQVQKMLLITFGGS
jgi:hypothetical protein